MEIDNIIKSLTPVISTDTTAGAEVAATAGIAVATPAMNGEGICVIAYGIFKASKS